MSGEMLIFVFGFIVQVWKNWVSLQKERRGENAG